MLYPKKKIKALEAQQGNIVEEKAARRRATMKSESERHGREFAELSTAEERLAWLRRTLRTKRVTSGKLMPTMDTDRSGRVSLGEFERGLRAVDVQLKSTADYRKLFKAVDSDGSAFVSKDEPVCVRVCAVAADRADCVCVVGGV